MKKAILALLVAITTITPALAGGVYRSAPYSYHKGHDGHRHAVKQSNHRTSTQRHSTRRSHNHDHGDVGNAVGSLILLPFRVVSSTLHGTAGVVADQDLKGFEKGFNKF